MPKALRNKYLCIIQARTGSTRLPKKVLLEVNGAPLLEHMIVRLRLSKRINKIVVATTTKPEDDQIAALCERIQTDCFRGSEHDVLDRFFQCARKYPEYGTIIRLTADCPLIDSKLLDKQIEFFEAGRYDYLTNTFLSDASEGTFPDGMDAEIFTLAALEEAAARSAYNSEREHVTPYIRNNPALRKGQYTAAVDFSHFRFTVDLPEDFEVVQFLIESSKPEDDYLTLIAHLTKRPDVMMKNIKIQRNQGYHESLKGDFVVKKI